MKVVGFDLEIAKVIKNKKDFDKDRPLGISCAAIAGEGVLVYPPHINPRLMHSAKLSCREVNHLIDSLWRYHRHSDYEIVTWNGLKFDFAILAEEGSQPEKCAVMALDHIDIAFQMLCEKGFMIGLETAAEGLGLEGKTKGVHGATAPVMWQRDRESQDKVLEYVGQDAKLNVDIYEAIMEKGHLPWTSKRGRLNYWRPNVVVIASGKGHLDGHTISGFYLTEEMETRLLTVKEALKIPLPDTSWITKPITRRSCYEWTGYKP